MFKSLSEQKHFFGWDIRRTFKKGHRTSCKNNISVVFALRQGKAVAFFGF